MFQLEAPRGKNGANEPPQSLIVLQTVPHARAGDKTLRFDSAASQVIPPADEPLGTPLLFERNERPLLFHPGVFARDLQL